MTTQTKILTVGDGDLTYALSLCRAFGNWSTTSRDKDSDTPLKRAKENGGGQVQVVATTLLPTPASLFSTYSDNAREVVEELQHEHQATVIYGVDACFLRKGLDRARDDLFVQELRLLNQAGETSVDLNETHVAQARLTAELKIPKYFDLIVFNHPHLGTYELGNSDGSDSAYSDDKQRCEAAHSLRHHALLCHYFRSALDCLRKGGSNHIQQRQPPKGDELHESDQPMGRDNVSVIPGVVQISLCGMQPQTWNLQGATRKATISNNRSIINTERSEPLGSLDLIGKFSTHVPVHEWICMCHPDYVEMTSEPEKGHTKHNSFLVPLPPQRHHAAPRRYRNGKLGSRHYLGRYGYRHRRTEGTAFHSANSSHNRSSYGSGVDMNVSGGTNFLFRWRHSTSQIPPIEENGLVDGKSQFRCDVCQTSFNSKEKLTSHSELPALPDIMKNLPSMPDGERDSQSNHKEVNCHRDPDTGRTFSTLYGLRTYQEQQKNLRKRKDSTILDSDRTTSKVALSSNVGELNDKGNNENLSTNKDNLQMGNKSKLNPCPEGGLTDKNSHASTKLSVVVPSRYKGTRLRWFCRRNDIGLFKSPSSIPSKKVCEDWIKDGYVTVNHVVALDSSRILSEGDRVEVMVNDSHVTKFSKSQSTVLDRKAEVSTVDGATIGSPVSLADTFDCGKVAVVAVFDSANFLQNNQIFAVVFKPAGIRSCGSYTPNSLEAILPGLLSRSTVDYIFEPDTCTCLTKLEAGCSGLCLLSIYVDTKNVPSERIQLVTTRIPNKQPRRELQLIRPNTRYTFTALIHGIPPPAWAEKGICIELPTEGARRWKRKEPSEEEWSDVLHAAERGHTKDSCHRLGPVDEENNLQLVSIRVISSVRLKACRSKINHAKDDLDQYCESKETVCHVSTLQITTAANSGRLSNALCYFLRRMKVPVLNDRFCQGEKLSLPRPMKNIIKNKLSLGCYGMDVEFINKIHGFNYRKTIGIDVPKRLHSTYWEHFLNKK